jgi:hypothetical protein
VIAVQQPRGQNIDAWGIIMPPHNVALSYEDYVQGLQQLSPEEQVRLVELVLENLKHAISTRPASTTSKLANLTPHRLIQGDPDDLVTFQVGEWTEACHL